MSEAIKVDIHCAESFMFCEIEGGLYRLVDMPDPLSPDFIPVAKEILMELSVSFVDCVKFRNKIGMDVVLDALKMYWHTRKTNLEKLFEYAKLFRLEKILKPIMETIVSG